MGLLTSEHDNFAILRQYEEQLCDLKIEFADIHKSLMLSDLKERDDLSLLQSRIDKGIFDWSLDVKKLLFNSATSSDSGALPVDNKGARLPKIDVPKFDGNIIGWRMFC